MENKISRAIATSVVCTACPTTGTITAFVKQNAQLEGVDVSVLLKKSREVLSTAEIPGRFLLVDSFPLSHHGKTDRRKLAQLSGLPAPVPPSVDSPAQLVSLLWTRVLGREPRPQDNFLAVGGDSFLAVALVTAVTSAFPDVPVGLLETILSVNYETVLQKLVQQEIVTDQPASKRVKLITVGEKDQAVTSSGDEKVFEPRALENGSINGVGYTFPQDTSSDRMAGPGVVYRCKGRQNRPLPSSTGPQSNKFSLEWKVDFEKCIDSSPLYVARNGGEDEAVVLVGSHSGWVKCLRYSSGQEVWATR